MNTILPLLENFFSIAKGAIVWLFLLIYDAISLTSAVDSNSILFTSPATFTKSLRFVLSAIAVNSSDFPSSNCNENSLPNDELLILLFEFITIKLPPVRTYSKYLLNLTLSDLKGSEITTTSFENAYKSASLKTS